MTHMIIAKNVPTFANNKLVPELFDFEQIWYHIKFTLYI